MMRNEADNPKHPGAIKDAVRRFRVCYEVWPEYEMVRSEKRQIGLALELSGTHEPGIQNPEAGCIHCREVFTALREIAKSILPPESRPSRYELDPYDHAIHHSRRRADRPEVILTIRIFHREDFDRPLDECQRRCLTQMLQGLRELGASEARWRKGPEARSRSASANKGIP